MINQKVYQIKEIQAITKLSRNTIMKLINDKNLIAIRAGKRYLIPAWAFDKFLAGE